eukprot:CAMPEP_0206540938 /NCGR_PEP_ID=MMETSP0325_2-20121206/9313_1 /ASSEMBLY_ACC=CAM_ASM_000347 /TAXON_ID=2866 /ORGANISM="Crypthecodinium cohnii, Strain Seligo" /LENGTH=152 /DNA_ID=CAMNT_0054038777 /DNA_START=146 /DNA_END=601 /DNA_ORIENTATION=+
MAMDSCLTAILRETMLKEQKFQKRVKDEQRRQRELEGIPIVKATPDTKKTSCQIAQLDQMMGFQENPHKSLMRGRLHPQPDSLLRYGVSKDGQGRAAYLDQRGRVDPSKRYGRQVTTQHEIGWTALAATKSYKTSPFAHRPMIEGDFYRPMG